jgi:hypothetical protein
MSVTDAAATTLDTATLARFVRDGYLTVQTSFPPSLMLARWCSTTKTDDRY